MKQLAIKKQITNRESISLDAYLLEISKLPMITAEEEVKLAPLIRSGDLLALNALVKANLRFVVSVAKQYQNKGLGLTDLINEGNVGLLHAAKRFDETRGFKFISYAVWWIRQSIIKALSDQIRIVRLPLNRIVDISRIKKASHFLEQIYERPPTVEEMAEELDMAVSQVSQSMSHSGMHLSMDAPIREDEDSNFYDLIQSKDTKGPDNGLLNESLTTEIDRVLNTLKPKEKEVVCMFYGLGSYDRPMSLQEIGSVFKITTERIRQIKESAIRNLGQGSRKELLERYLG